jgi:hypothetical protein
MNPKLKRILFALLIVTFGVLAYRTACAIPYYTGMIDKRELYRRGVLDFLEKQKTVYEKYWHYTYIEMDAPPPISKKPVGFYVLNEDDFEQWYKKFIKLYNPKDPLSIEKILFEEFNATKVDNISNYLVLDKNLSKAGFKKLVVFHASDRMWLLYGKYSFLLKNIENKTEFIRKFLVLLEKDPIDWIKSDAKEYIQSKIKPVFILEVDKCGKVTNYDIDQVLKDIINI